MSYENYLKLQEASLYPPTITTESETNQFASESEFNNVEEIEEIVESSNLTEKESEVLQLIVEGCSNAVIAEKLCTTVSAVKIHVRSMQGKIMSNRQIIHQDLDIY